MKKLLLLGCLAVAGLSFAPAQAGASWLFNHCCCSHKYSMKICITPYNAFSPVCAGNFSCVGCNPFCCGPQQQPPPPPWWANAQACCPPVCNSNCGDSGCLPSTVPAPTPAPANGGNGAAPGTSSAPPLAPQAPIAQGYPAPMPYGLVRPATGMPQGYYPNPYNAVANPYNMAPTMPVPNYNYQSNYNPYANGMNPYANMNPYGANPYANTNPYGNMNPYGGMNPYGR